MGACLLCLFKTWASCDSLLPVMYGSNLRLGFISSPATKEFIIHFLIDFESFTLQAEGEISFVLAVCRQHFVVFPPIIQRQNIDTINRWKSRFSHRSKRMLSPAGYRCTTSPTKSLSKAFFQTLVVSCHSMGIVWTEHRE